MAGHQQKNGSSLFLVRLWQPESEDAQSEWSGRVVHIISGKASNFLHLPGLSALLLEMLGERQGNQEKADSGIVPQDRKKGDYNEG